jgi:putative tryptophan/tyrosine transport system substrate-binding protein
MIVTIVRLIGTVMLGAGLSGLLSAEQDGGHAVVPRVGYIGLRPLTESAASMDSINALKEGLRDLGHVEGKDYALDIRIADNDPSRYPALTHELVQLKVKLIVAASTPAAVAIHKTNPAMPIVVRGPDLVGAGLAASEDRPGGVVTGIDELAEGIAERRLRLFKQAVPAISHVAVLSSAPTETGHLKAFAEAQRAADDLGLKLTTFRIAEKTDVGAIFTRLKGEGVDAVFLPGGILSRPIQQRLVELAGRQRLPAMYPIRDYVELGGLMSYSYRNPEMFRAAATYVDRILKGARAGDLPITIWDRYYFTVNLQNATTLGLTIPPAVLSKADEVIK